MYFKNVSEIVSFILPVAYPFQINSMVSNRPFHKLRQRYREPRFRIIAITIDSQRSDLKVFPIDKSMT